MNKFWQFGPRLSGLKMDLDERFPVRVAKCTWEVRIAHFKEGGILAL